MADWGISRQELSSKAADLKMFVNPALLVPYYFFLVLTCWQSVKAILLWMRWCQQAWRSGAAVNWCLARWHFGWLFLWCGVTSIHVFRRCSASSLHLGIDHVIDRIWEDCRLREQQKKRRANVKWRTLKPHLILRWSEWTAWVYF